MAENSKISWTDHTFNPWIGCQKVAPGCEHCYAEAFAKRTGQAKWGPQGTRRKTSEAYWRTPLKWNREAKLGVCVDCGTPVFNVVIDCACGQFGAIGETRRPRVFCASLADVFEDWDGWIVNSQGERLWCMPETHGHHAPLTMDDLRRDLFALIDQTPHLDWLLLTKRPENVGRVWPVDYEDTADEFEDEDEREFFSETVYKRFENVWLGTSVSDQATADRNVPLLLKCRDLCPVLFLSCEPLLGPVNLRSTPIYQRIGTDRDILGYPAIDWVICGGESGPKHRPMDLDWAFSLRDQCRAAGVPLWFKQVSAFRAGQGEDALGDVIHEVPTVEVPHARR